MDNRDMPAMPVEELKCKGLSKREYIATMAMQGLLSSVGESEHYVCYSDCAKAAIGFTDALLKQLEESE